MTDRLYYTDAYRRSFDAEVTSCAAAADRYEVTLSATAFYPSSGGQPHDLGTLGGRRVIDVVDGEDGRLVHVLDGRLEVGAQVEGAVDWARRFDHMQQHTGQHVLSAAFERTGQARTESFHLGASAATIDLQRPVSPAEIAAAEAEANRVVWEDRPVEVRFVSAEEAASLPLRKESGRVGTLRLIEVQDFDLSACGGTHVARSGAIGVIAVTGWEKFKGGTRVEFLCGARALARLREWRDALAATNRLLSVSPAELAPAVERLQSENKALARSARGFQEQLAGHVARDLVATGERSGNRVIVAQALEGWDAAGLKALAAGVAAHPGAAAAMFSAASPALVVIARAPDVAVDAAAVLKALVARFGGKGGGKPDLAQGGGLTGEVSEIVAAARIALGEAEKSSRTDSGLSLGITPQGQDRGLSMATEFDSLQPGQSPTEAVAAFVTVCKKQPGTLFIPDDWFASFRARLLAALPAALTEELAEGPRDAIYRRRKLEAVVDFIERQPMTWEQFDKEEAERAFNLRLERSRQGFFPWADVEAAARDERLQSVERPHYHPQGKKVGISQLVTDRQDDCPGCGRPASALTWIYFSSPPWTWEQLCGSAGWLVICETCHMQVDFFQTVMN